MIGFFIYFMLTTGQLMVEKIGPFQTPDECQKARVRVIYHDRFDVSKLYGECRLMREPKGQGLS
jgi:hypothetical protein